MSEYQYYEFLAVDRMLNSSEIETIRGFSSRAEISATRFTNEYHWGSFRGNAEDFLARYYDLHLYYANWGTHTFGIGLPAAAVESAAFKPYFPREGAAECSTRGSRTILLFSSDSESGEFDGFEGQSMAELAPLREEILGGDLRPLYLGWLAGIFNDGAHLDDDAMEPPVPAGMAKLTPPQKIFAEFMRIDEDLLDVAARSSGPLSSAAPDPRPWLSALPTAEKDAFLLAVMEGRGGQATRELRANFRRVLGPANAAPAGTRTVGELRAAAEIAGAEREKRDAETRARRRAAAEVQAAKERAAYLDSIAPTRADLWRQVDVLIATRLPKNYDACVKILCDLRDLAGRHNHVSEYDRRMTEFREIHRGKSSLQGRLRKAGLAQP